MSFKTHHGVFVPWHMSQSNGEHSLDVKPPSFEAATAQKVDRDISASGRTSGTEAIIAMKWRIIIDDDDDDMILYLGSAICKAPNVIIPIDDCEPPRMHLPIDHGSKIKDSIAIE
jgi:hypothetical protein